MRVELWGESRENGHSLPDDVSFLKYSLLVDLVPVFYHLSHNKKNVILFSILIFNFC